MKGPNKSALKIQFTKGLSNPTSTVFEHKGLTNPSKKDVPQKRVQWARSCPKHVTKTGSIFLPKGPNKSVAKIEFPKGLSNPPSTVFEHKGLRNPSKKDVPQKRVQWARSCPKHVTKTGSIFLPKGPNKSVAKIEFPKGLSNPPSTVFEHKGLKNPSIYL